MTRGMMAFWMGGLSAPVAVVAQPGFTGGAGLFATSKRRFVQFGRSFGAYSRGFRKWQ